MPRRVSTHRRMLRAQHRCSVFGNLCFFVGSLLFLSERLQLIGVLLFALGSLGMLLGSFLPAFAYLWARTRESDSGEGDCTLAVEMQPGASLPPQPAALEVTPR